MERLGHSNFEDGCQASAVGGQGSVIVAREGSMWASSASVEGSSWLADERQAKSNLAPDATKLLENCRRASEAYAAPALARSAGRLGQIWANGRIARRCLGSAVTLSRSVRRRGRALVGGEAMPGSGNLAMGKAGARVCASQCPLRPPVPIRPLPAADDESLSGCGQCDPHMHALQRCMHIDQPA